MTTLTIDASVKLSQTHFKTMDECAAFMAQWNFERELDEGAERIKNKNISEFINI